MGQNNSLWLWRVLTVGTAVMTLFASPSSSAQSNQSLKGKTLVIASWGSRRAEECSQQRRCLCLYQVVRRAS